MAITDELPPPIELTNATGTNLQEMNEDSLLEIFSSKSLSPKDLLSLTDTCAWFLPIVQRIAPKALRITDFYIKFGNSCKATRAHVESIFENVGSSLSTVEIEGPFRSEDSSLVQLITKHCNDNNLKNLMIQQIQIPDVLAVELKPIFKQLQTLDLRCVSIMNDATLFGELDSLVSLSVVLMTNCDAILKNNFPKLERFQYSKGGSIAHIEEQTFENLSTFISCHSGLKELNLYVSQCDDSRAVILQAIGNNCKELEKLNLMLGRNVDASHLNTIVAAESLKTLQLWSFSFENYKLFSQLTELRHLTFCDCPMPQHSEPFPSLTRLKTLKMYGPNRTDLVDIIRRLRSLEVLALTSLLLEDQGMLSQIVSTIRGRSNVLTRLIGTWHRP